MRSVPIRRPASRALILAGLIVAAHGSGSAFGQTAPESPPPLPPPALPPSVSTVPTPEPEAPPGPQTTTPFADKQTPPPTADGATGTGRPDVLPAQTPRTAPRLLAARLRGRELTLRFACTADGRVEVRVAGARRGALATAPLRCAESRKVRLTLHAPTARRVKTGGIRLVAIVTSAGRRSRLPIDVAAGRRMARLSSVPSGASFTSKCVNDWNGTFSFPHLRADSLPAHPLANQNQVGGTLRTGHQWVYYFGRIAYQTASGAWIYDSGDWFAIQDGTSGALGMIGSWWRYNGSTSRWEAPTGAYGTAMEPRSGAFIGYSPGGTVYVSGWIYWGPIENYAGYAGEWGQVDWAQVVCRD